MGAAFKRGGNGCYLIARANRIQTSYLNLENVLLLKGPVFAVFGAVLSAARDTDLAVLGSEGQFGLLGASVG